MNKLTNTQINLLKVFSPESCQMLQLLVQASHVTQRSTELLQAPGLKRLLHLSSQLLHLHLHHLQLSLQHLSDQDEGKIRRRNNGIFWETGVQQEPLTD